MNDEEIELMTKAWSDWFSEDDDIPEVGFVFRKAWEFQHKRYHKLIDTYEGVINVLQTKIDKLENKCPVGHPSFCTCANCTEDSPELF